MRNLKKFLAVILSFTMIFVTACSNQKAETEKLEEVNVVLDWYPNAIHAFIYDAIEKGYYEKEGLKVNIIFPANANDAITLTASGKAELGVYYPHDVIQARADQKIPVKVIGAIVQSPLNIILSLKEKNINTPKDFEGKTIGYAGTTLSEAMIKSIMKSQNVDVSKTKFLDVGFDLMSSMTTHKVDATIGCLVNHEVPQLEEEGFEVNYFSIDKYAIPSYPELVFVTSDDVISKKKEVLQKFIRASKLGFKDMKKSPDDTLKILLDNQNKENFPLSETVEKKSMDTLLPIMETPEAKFLSVDNVKIKNMIDWMKSENIITNDIAVEDVIEVIE